MSAAASLLLQPGLEPVPDYVLLKRLGGGGFGEVWKARGPGGIEVALKFIKLDGNAGAIEKRALDIIRAIRHPNLLTPFAAWSLANVLVMGMDLADGTLLDRLREVQQQGLPGIPRDELLKYMYDAARGLDHLNQRKHKLGDKEQVGIQHRDVKPQNILLVGGGIKVADFGLARVLDKSQSGHSGGMTVTYAAPEFFKNQTSEHSDQYCLAMVYCELRVGRLPFEADSVFALIHLQLNTPPDLLPLPEEERPVVARALSKEPKDRWPSCEVFVEALRAAPPTGKVTARQMKKPVPQPDTDPKSSGAKDTDPPLAPAQPQPRTKVPPPAVSPRKHRIVLALAFILATSLLALWLAGIFPSKSRFVLDLGDGVTMEFVRIPAGKFKMGSPETEKDHNNNELLHDVEISRDFYLAKYPVTQEQWQAVMGNNPSWYTASGGGRDKVQGIDTLRFPVESVSWDDAQAFLKRLRERDKHGRPFRLPTEAEWEYACRGGTKTPYYFGSGLDGTQANCDGNSPYGTLTKGPYLERPTAVGSYESKAPHPWGLCDMHGNVWQWCADAYDKDYSQNKVTRDPSDTDPTVLEHNKLRVLRGGSWNNYARRCCAAVRDWNARHSRNDFIGLRVCLPLS